MPVDVEIVKQRSRQRLNEEYQMTISDEGLKSSGIKERYAVIYKEELDKEVKKQTSNVPVSKPVIMTCSGNQQPTQRKKDPNIKCNFSTVTVEKAGRKYTLQIDKNTPSGENVLEIVAGPYINTKDVTITVNGLEGPCVDGHKNKVMDLVNPKPVSKSDTVLKFKAASFYYIPFIDSLWPSGAPCKTYDIPISTCNGKQSAIIKVYPDIEYDFSLALNLSQIQKSFSQYKKDIELDKDKVALKFNGSIKQDTVDYKLEKTFENINKAVAVYSKIMNTVTSMTKTINKTVEVDFRYLSLKLGIKSKWVEIEGSPKCGYQCEFKMGMNPVFGISVTVDALSTFIQTIPIIGILLSKIKDVGEESGIVKLNLKFIFSGDLSCDFIAIKKVTDKDIETTVCDTNGKVSVKAIANASASSKKFGDSAFVEAGAEASGEASIKIGAKIKPLSIPIYYDFNGLEFSYAAYAKASGGWITIEKKTKGSASIFEKQEGIEITTIYLNER
jgi:hypothetical protein